MTFEFLGPEHFTPVVHGAGGGEAVRMSLRGSSDVITFKVTAQESAGTISFLEYDAQAHSPGVQPHYHDGHEEIFYVISGTLRLRLGDEIVDAGPGGCVFVPRNVVHAFWNPTDDPVKFVGAWTPAGFEALFTERQQLVAEKGELTDAENAELAARHGVRYVALLPGEAH